MQKGSEGCFSVPSGVVLVNDLEDFAGKMWARHTFVFELELHEILEGFEMVYVSYALFGGAKEVLSPRWSDE